MGESSGPQEQEEAARRLLDKLRDFSAALDPDERALLGALLAPGIALAFTQTGRDEVEAFAMEAGDPVGWRPDRLPGVLVHVLVARGVRVVEL